MIILALTFEILLVIFALWQVIAINDLREENQYLREQNKELKEKLKRRGCH